MTKLDPFEGLGPAIEQTRVEKGLTRDEVRRAAQISVEYLGKIERGKRVPQPAKLAAIAMALGVTPAQLIARAQTLQRNQGQARSNDVFPPAIMASGAAAALLFPGLGIPLAAAALGAMYGVKRQQAEERAQRSRDEIKAELEQRLNGLDKQTLIVMLALLDNPDLIG